MFSHKHRASIADDSENRSYLCFYRYFLEIVQAHWKLTERPFKQILLFCCFDGVLWPKTFSYASQNLIKMMYYFMRHYCDALILGR